MSNSLVSSLDEVEEIEFVQVLTIKNQKKNPLDENITKLKKIKRLEVISKQVKAFPEQIKELRSLQSFSMTGQGKVENIEYLFQVPSLEIIKLKDIHLSDIQDLTPTAPIKKLNCYGTKLERFPDFICELKELEELSITGGTFTEVPLKLGELPNLKRVVLDNNKITEIPEAIYKITNLEYLSLDNNPLSKPAKAKLKEYFNVWDHS